MIFLFWIGFAIIVGVAANNRGRNSIGWCLLAVVISPLLAGLLLFAMPRQSLSDIATLAMIEATPEGSRSRQLLAEHEAKAARKATAHWFWGHNNCRPWSPRSPRSPSTSNGFTVGMSIWVAVLLFAGLGLLGYKSKPQDISAVAAPAAVSAQPTAKPAPKPQHSKQMDCINLLMMIDRQSGKSTGGWLFPDLSKYEAACPER